MCPAAQGNPSLLASLCEGGGSAKRWQREFVGADDSVRPNSAKRCHSEPVRAAKQVPLGYTLAWESVSQRGAAALMGRLGRRPLRVDNAPAP